VQRSEITADTIERHRAEIDALIADFRAMAARLVQIAHEEGVFDAYEHGEEYPDEIDDADERWWLHMHDPHCRFENRRTREVVEAHIYDPTDLDAFFVLEFAQTSGRHEKVVAICPKGFHDMVRVLDVVEPEG
jgi:hypothetical protein